MNRLSLPTLVLVAVLASGALAPTGAPFAADAALAHETQAEGAFTCDFDVDPSQVPMEQIAPIIERDRMYMAAQPGMLHKHIPLFFDTTGLRLQSGGRYLFETAEHAEAYHSWITHDFKLDGMTIFERPEISNAECYAWSVVGVQDFAPLERQVLVRMERWSVPETNQRRLLKERWPALRDEAARRGLTSVWLLYERSENLVGIVAYADRTSPALDELYELDVAGLAALAAASPLGLTILEQGWSNRFDRTHWVLTIWLPFELGDQGSPALWPHSPPLPEPYCGDGVCEVSRGESFCTCTEDCPEHCGDGVCQADEDTRRCPGDCRLP